MDYFVANLCMQTYQDPNILCNQKMLEWAHQWVLLVLVLLAAGVGAAVMAVGFDKSPNNPVAGAAVFAIDIAPDLPAF
jgi:hypothetical protein